MNGRKAKILRRMAYGDMSLKNPRLYGVTHRSVRPVPGVLKENGLPLMGDAITIANDPASPRGMYQRLKKMAV